MSDRGELTDAARNALLQAIAEQANGAGTAMVVLILAEAFAWVAYPNQSHGGGVKPDAK